MRGALDARGTAIRIFLVSLTRISSPALLFRVNFDELHFFGTVGHDNLLPGWEALFERRNDCWVDGLGEVDNELDDKATLGEGILVHGHTLAGDAFNVTLLDDGTRHRGHDEVSLVERLDDLLETT